MAATQPCVINELLYYLTNNINCFQIDSFFSTTAEFFNNEEIVAAKKCLLNEFEVLNTDKVKFVTHGHTKKDKILDISDILSHINTNIGLSRLPTYVSANLSRVPQKSFQQSCDVLVEKVQRIFSAKLSAIEQEIQQIKISHADDLKEININVQNLNSQVSNMFIKFQHTNVCDKVNSRVNKLWSDTMLSPNATQQTNATLNVNNKRLRTLTHEMDLASTFQRHNDISLNSNNFTLNNAPNSTLPITNNNHKSTAHNIDNNLLHANANFPTPT